MKVLSISYNGLIKVSGLEVIDQTPLIDIKPVWNKPPKEELEAKDFSLK